MKNNYQFDKLLFISLIISILSLCAFFIGLILMIIFIFFNFNSLTIIFFNLIKLTKIDPSSQKNISLANSVTKQTALLFLSFYGNNFFLFSLYFIFLGLFFLFLSLFFYIFSYSIKFSKKCLYFFLHIPHKKFKFISLVILGIFLFQLATFINNSNNNSFFISNNNYSHSRSISTSTSNITNADLSNKSINLTSNSNRTALPSNSTHNSLFTKEKSSTTNSNSITSSVSTPFTSESIKVNSNSFNRTWKTGNSILNYPSINEFQVSFPKGTGINYDLAIDNTNTYIIILVQFSASNYGFYEYLRDGTYINSFSSTSCVDPYQITFNQKNNLVVACGSSNNIITMNIYDFSTVLTFGSAGSGNGQFNIASGVAVDSSGNYYVTDYNNHRIQKFDSTGTYVSQFSTSVSGSTQPEYIQLDSSNNLFFRIGTSLIAKYTSAGAYVTSMSFFPTTGQTFGEAIDPTNNIYTSDPTGSKVYKYSNSLSFINEFTDTQTRFLTSSHIWCIDISSNGGLYVLRSNTDLSYIEVQIFSVNNIYQVNNNFNNFAGNTIVTSDNYNHISNFNAQYTFTMYDIINIPVYKTGIDFSFLYGTENVVINKIFTLNPSTNASYSTGEITLLLTLAKNNINTISFNLAFFDTGTQSVLSNSSSVTFTNTLMEVNNLTLTIQSIFVESIAYSSHYRLQTTYQGNNIFQSDFQYYNYNPETTINIYAPLYMNLTYTIPTSSFTLVNNTYILTLTQGGQYIINFLSGTNYGQDYARQPYIVAIQDKTSNFFSCPGFENCYSNDWVNNQSYPFDSVSLNYTIVDSGVSSLMLSATTTGTHALDYDHNNDYLHAGYYYISFSYYIESISASSFKLQIGYNTAWENVYDLSYNITNRWVNYYLFVHTDGSYYDGFIKQSMEFLLQGSGKIFLDNFHINTVSTIAQTIQTNQLQISSQMNYWTQYGLFPAPNQNCSLSLWDRTAQSQLWQTYLTTDATGQISYDFKGTLDQKEYSIQIFAINSITSDSDFEINSISNYFQNIQYTNMTISSTASQTGNYGLKIGDSGINQFIGLSYQPFKGGKFAVSFDYKKSGGTGLEISAGYGYGNNPNQWYPYPGSPLFLTPSTSWKLSPFIILEANLSASGYFGLSSYRTDNTYSQYTYVDNFIISPIAEFFFTPSNPTDQDYATNILNDSWDFSNGNLQNWVKYDYNSAEITTIQNGYLNMTKDANIYPYVDIAFYPTSINTSYYNTLIIRGYGSSNLDYFYIDGYSNGNWLTGIGVDYITSSSMKIYSFDLSPYNGAVITNLKVGAQWNTGSGLNASYIDYIRLIHTDTISVKKGSNYITLQSSINQKYNFNIAIDGVSIGSYQNNQQIYYNTTYGTHIITFQPYSITNTTGIYSQSSVDLFSYTYIIYLDYSANLNTFIISSDFISIYYTINKNSNVYVYENDSLITSKTTTLQDNIKWNRNTGAQYVSVAIKFLNADNSSEFKWFNTSYTNDLVIIITNLSFYTNLTDVIITWTSLTTSISAVVSQDGASIGTFSTTTIVFAKSSLVGQHYVSVQFTKQYYTSNAYSFTYDVSSFSVTSVSFFTNSTAVLFEFNTNTNNVTAYLSQDNMFKISGAQNTIIAFVQSSVPGTHYVAINLVKLYNDNISLSFTYTVDEFSISNSQLYTNSTDVIFSYSSAYNGITSFAYENGVYKANSSTTKLVYPISDVVGVYYVSIILTKQYNTNITQSFSYSVTQFSITKLVFYPNTSSYFVSYLASLPNVNISIIDDGVTRINNLDNKTLTLNKDTAQGYHFVTLIFSAVGQQNVSYLETYSTDALTFTTPFQYYITDGISITMYYALSEKANITITFDNQQMIVINNTQVGNYTISAGLANGTKMFDVGMHQLIFVAHRDGLTPVSQYIIWQINPSANASPVTVNSNFNLVGLFIFIAILLTIIVVLITRKYYNNLQNKATKAVATALLNPKTTVEDAVKMIVQLKQSISEDVRRS